MKINVRVPASSANLGSGVDTLGLALSLYLYAVFEESDRPEVRFGRGFDAPLSEADNYVLKAVSTLGELAGERIPSFRLTLDTDIPIARGLGSSSAALVAGLFGANALLRDPLPQSDLIALAAKLEGHPDNAVPAAVGGFTLAMNDGPEILYRRYLAPECCCVAAVPDYHLSTEKARGVLPENVPLRTAVAQLQRACLLTGALAAGDLAGLSKLTADELFTPARSVLMPGTAAARSAALEAGALCSFVSGAGPTVLALSYENAEAIGGAMQKAFADEGIAAKLLLLRPDNEGARVTVEE